VACAGGVLRPARGADAPGRGGELAGRDGRLGEGGGLVVRMATWNVNSLKASLE